MKYIKLFNESDIDYNYDEIKNVIKYCLIAQNYSDAAKGITIYNDELHCKQIEKILYNDNLSYNEIKNDLYYYKNLYLVKAVKVAKKAKIDVYLDEDEKGYEVLYFEFPFGQVSFHFYDDYWLNQLPNNVIKEKHKWNELKNTRDILLKAYKNVKM